MVGLDLAFEGTDVINRLVQRKVLLNLTNTSVVRWLPPLTINSGHIDLAVNEVAATLSEMTARSRVALSAGPHSKS